MNKYKYPTGLLSAALLSLILIVSGCKIGIDFGDDGETDSIDSNMCSCCSHNSPDIVSCKLHCRTQTWRKKDGETCEEARKRIYGPSIECCPGAESTYREINTQHYSAIKFNGIMLASNSDGIPKTLLEPEPRAITASYPSKSCLVECKDNTSYCILINKSDTRFLSKEIYKLYNIFSSEGNVVRKKDLMEAFDVSSDPCERTDTYIRNEILYNTGSGCMFSIELTASGVTEDISFHMPKRISGKFKRNPDLTALFSSTYNSPYIEFNSYLNEDFGGYVASITISPKWMIVGTERGCILISENN